VEAVVLAVPFLHEYRLGVRSMLASPSELLQAVRGAFRDFYSRLTDLAEHRYDGAPLLATGHLTCVGVEKGDCPADIHLVGTIGGLPPDIFDERLQYVALGHIHRGYRVGESRAYYSGTPVALSLKEARSARKVRLVEVAKDVRAAAVVRSLEVPSPRRIVELAGQEQEVAAQLDALGWDEPLPPLVFARVSVERYSAQVEESLRKVALGRGKAGPHLVQVRQELVHAPSDVQARVVSAGLCDLQPEEVFLRLCEEKQQPADEALLNAFRSLLSGGEGEVDADAEDADAAKVDERSGGAR
jgi:DNA repair protein SbcD/Mre11